MGAERTPSVRAERLGDPAAGGGTDVACQRFGGGPAGSFDRSSPGWPPRKPGSRRPKWTRRCWRPPKPVTFTLSARRRVRHWVDGLVIGSEIFVRDVMSRVRPKATVAKHRLARAAMSVSRRRAHLLLAATSHDHDLSRPFPPIQPPHGSRLRRIGSWRWSGVSAQLGSPTTTPLASFPEHVFSPLPLHNPRSPLHRLPPRRHRLPVPYSRPSCPKKGNPPHGLAPPAPCLPRICTITLAAPFFVADIKSLATQNDSECLSPMPARICCPSSGGLHAGTKS